MDIKRTLLTGCLLVAAAMIWAQAPNGTNDYYQAADGKKGAALKTALCGIISDHTTLSYKSLNEKYAKTDKRPDGYLYDIYSNITSYTIDDTNTGTEGKGYNKEHTVPQSWFNGASPMYSDIMHVLPSDSWVNSMRGNLPFGETSNPTNWSANKFSKKGPCDSSIGYSGTVFEPNDEYKGDLARIYFYMVTCYENKIANSTWGGGMFEGGAYPAFKGWALRMLLRWAAEDPVSQKEIDRNNAVDEVQGNRNPFVDYPGLEQYIWGDKMDEAFSYDNYSGAASETVSQPLFSPTAGTYIESVNVSISTTTAGATIYYTTDGTTPTASSTRYNSPFTLTATTTVKAVAMLNGESSRVATATYSIKQSGESGDGIIWAEDWKGAAAGTAVQNVENETAIYSSGDEGERTKVYNEKLAGGEAPELLISKSGYFTATVALGGVSGNMTLTFRSNRDNLTVSSSTTGVTISGGANSSKVYTYTINVPYGTQSLELKFVNSSSDNARADDFMLTGGETDPGPTPVTLAFSTDEATAIIGEAFTAPTLTISPADADIEVVYASDNTTVATVDAQTGEVTLINEGVATIIASFDGNDAYLAAEDATYMLTVTHAQQPATGEGVYEKITSTADLEDGRNYLLVDETDSRAYAGYETGKGIIGGVTISNSQIDLNQDGNTAQVLVLEKSGDNWLIRDGERYLALTANSNTLNSQTLATAAGTKWTITFDADGAVRINNVEHSDYYLQYNTSAGLFRCYKTNQRYPALYKELATSDIKVTIGATGYATMYYSAENLTVPEGVEATTYIVSDGQLSVTKTYAPGEVIPAGTAVVLYDGLTTVQTYTFAKAAADGTAPEANMLKGFDDNATTVGDIDGLAYTYYMLAVDPDTQDPASIGFYYGADGGAAFTSLAHKAYLAVPTASAKGMKAFPFAQPTAIRAIDADLEQHTDAVYSLSGQRMQPGSLPKGVYVKEGKKVVVGNK